MLEGIDPSALWRERSTMAGVWFFQSLWEKPIWEGVWPNFDPMDSVSLRTASGEWNVSGSTCLLVSSRSAPLSCT